MIVFLIGLLIGIVFGYLICALCTLAAAGEKGKERSDG